MVYDLPKIEALHVAQSSKNRIYKIERDRLKTRFFVYVNYPVINYHGLNISDAKKYVYADFIARSKRVLGRNVLFSLGYDNISSSILEIESKLDRPLSSFIAGGFEAYQKELKLLELSIDEEKEIIMNSEEYVTYIQEFFLFLHDKGLIKLKHGLVVYDDKRIYQKGEYYFDKGQYYSLSGNKLSCKNRNYYALNISTIKKELITNSKELKLNENQKSCLLERLCYIQGIKLVCNTNRDVSLEIKLESPEYASGMSFIVLNPNYIDIKPFIEDSEYDEINEFLLSSEDVLLYTGSYISNPIVDFDVPIFVSNIFNEAIHIGNPSTNDMDENVASKYGLPYNPIIDYINDECVLVNSGRFNGMSIDEAREEITSYLHSLHNASSYSESMLDELIISSVHKFGVPVPLHNDQTHVKLPVVYNLKHDVKLEAGDLADKILVKDFLSNEFVKYLLPNAIRLKGNTGILNFESKEAFDEIGLFNKIDVALFEQSTYLDEIIWLLVFNELWRRYYTSGFDSVVKENFVIKPILDEKLTYMHRDNNNLISIRELIEKHGSTIIRIYYANSEIDADYYVYSEDEIEEAKAIIEKIIKVYYYPIDDCCRDLDYFYEKFTTDAKRYAKEYDFKNYLSSIIEFVDCVHNVKRISRNQAKGLLIILSVLTPALAEQIKNDVLNLKEPLYYYSWPE